MNSMLYKKFIFMIKPFYIHLFLLWTFIVSGALNAQKELPNNVVVRFNFKLLNFTAIDDPTKLEGDLKSFLNSDGIKFADSLSNEGLDLKSLTVKKMFPYYFTKDSISISRLGNKVSIPPFWATFHVAVPEKSDYWKFYHQIENKYPLVIYADKPFILTEDNIPNDSLYDYQLGYYNFNGSNADINVEPAWDIETGKKFIKVGVFDSGVDTLHPDITILGGYAYYNDIEDDPSSGLYHTFGKDSRGHGTSCAGIIGAKRNNGIGVAGIAGGNGSDTTGVSILDFNLGIGIAPIGEVMSMAVIDAARSVGSYYNWNTNLAVVSGPNDDPYWNHTSGFGIYLANHSYGSYFIAESTGSGKELPNSDTVFIESDFYIPDCHLCRESYLFSLKNGVTNVVSRGNNPNWWVGADATLPNSRFPQKFDDSWIITTGASGNDGKRLHYPFNALFYDKFQSPIGQNVDIIAPGTRDLVTTLRSPNMPEYNIYGLYRPFNGTSAAAPHATGVAALLMSYYNKPCYTNLNLDPADIEYILQESATDVNPYVNGYDDSTGYGRLNALEAIKMIQFPEYQIVHPIEDPISTDLISIDTISINLNKAMEASYTGPLGSQFPLELHRNYLVERREYQLTYDFSNYMLPTTTLMDTWVRHSQTNSLRSYHDTIGSWDMIGQTGQYQWVTHPDTLGIEPMCTIDTVINTPTTKHIKMTGFYYHFLKKYSAGTPIESNSFELIPTDFWYPINPDETHPKMAYSVYLKDANFIERFDFPCDSVNLMYDSLMTVLSLENTDFNVYPNPSTNELNVQWSMAIDGTLQIIDLSGQVVYSEEFTKVKKMLTLPVSQLQAGTYFVNLKNSTNLSTTKRWIKL